MKTAACLALLLGASLCGCQSGLNTGKSAPLAKCVDVGLLCKSGDLPLLTNYFKAINENGARLVPLPYQGSTNPPPLPPTISALLIPGGDDIDPDLYHEKPAVNLDNPDRRFDDYECAAIRQAEARNIPMLGYLQGITDSECFIQGHLVPRPAVATRHERATPAAPQRKAAALFSRDHNSEGKPSFPLGQDRAPGGEQLSSSRSQSLGRRAGADGLVG